LNFEIEIYFNQHMNYNSRKIAFGIGFLH
jgi:hypothetical protein